MVPQTVAAPATMVTFSAPYSSGKVNTFNAWITLGGCGGAVSSTVTANFSQSTGVADLDSNNSVVACNATAAGANSGDSDFYAAVGIFNIPWKSNASFTGSVVAAWTFFLHMRLWNYAAHPGHSSASITVLMVVSAHDVTSNTTTYASSQVWHGETSGGFINKSLVNTYRSVTTGTMSFLKGHWYLFGSRLLVKIFVHNISMHAGKLVFASVRTIPPLSRLDTIKVI